jgi:TRAP-type mannitol/chloroaromatic compound transport system substrate-binding protein
MYDDAFGVVRIETWSNEMMEAFHSAWDDVAKEGDRDPVFKRVLDDLEKFRAPKPAVSPSASSAP